jgi:hypothetical protein
MRAEAISILKPSGKYNHGGAKFLMRMGSCPKCLGEGFGEVDSVSFDDHIDIFIFSVQEQIPDKSAHHIGAAVQLTGGFTQLDKGFHHVFGKAFPQEIVHHPRAFVAGFVVQIENSWFAGRFC